ncbi:MAG: winged helix-turn-helix transcriptional regulator [Armatimonadetes bacterium]|nr:helix-turn-helix domain-containing protein [Armatimonadota bacterium]MBS1702278.1 winged helix-turn-helix transcriptional regulator [Armatimonadota bacterium]
MSADSIVPMMKALADPTRFRIYSFLRESCCGIGIEDREDVLGPAGPTVGEVCCGVLGMDRIPSSLSFHLKELRNAGLIQMEKRGKNVFCSVNRDAQAKLAEYFSSHEICCAREEKHDPLLRKL